MNFAPGKINRKTKKENKINGKRIIIWTTTLSVCSVHFYTTIWQGVHVTHFVAFLLVIKGKFH